MLTVSVWFVCTTALASVAVSTLVSLYEPLIVLLVVVAVAPLVAVVFVVTVSSPFTSVSCVVALLDSVWLADSFPRMLLPDAFSVAAVVLCVPALTANVWLMIVSYIAVVLLLLSLLLAAPVTELPLSELLSLSCSVVVSTAVNGPFVFVSCVVNWSEPLSMSEYVPVTSLLAPSRRWPTSPSDPRSPSGCAVDSTSCRLSFDHPVCSTNSSRLLRCRFPEPCLSMNSSSSRCCSPVRCFPSRCRSRCRRSTACCWWTVAYHVACLDSSRIALLGGEEGSGGPGDG